MLKQKKKNIKPRAANREYKATSAFHPALALAHIFYETSSRDREDGSATGQPQGVGPEAYLSSTSQGPTPEDVRKDDHIRGRSRRFVKYAGYVPIYQQNSKKSFDNNHPL